MNALVYASEQIKTFHVPQCASSENNTLQKRNEQELCLLKKSVHISSTLLVADSYRIHAKCTILKAFQSLTNLLSFYGGRTPTSSSGKRKKVSEYISKCCRWTYCCRCFSQTAQNELPPPNR